MPTMKMQAYRAWIFIVVGATISMLFSVVNAPRVAAAPGLVQSAKASASATNPASASFPSAVTSGNLLVAICAYNASVTFIAPTGFSTAINQSGTVSLGIFYKVADGTESSVSCSFLNTSGSSTIMLHEFSGLRVANPLDAVNLTASSGTSATASSGSVTTTDNDLLVAGMVADSSTTPGNWTSSFITTPLAGTTGGKPAFRSSFSSGYLTTSGTGTYSSTVSITSGNWRGQIAAFKIAPAPLLSADIVDTNGTSIVNPSVTFPVLNRSFSCVSNTGQLSNAAQKIRVTNTTTTPGWSLSIAPTAGGSALWTKSGTPAAYYDFNDPGGSGCNDSDGDSNGGQLSVVPTSATITPQQGCGATAINLLSGATGFSGSNAITLASSGASTPFYCYWDITGLSLAQKVPASQTAGTYSLGLTITVVAN